MSDPDGVADPLPYPVIILSLRLILETTYVAVLVLAELIRILGLNLHVRALGLIKNLPGIELGRSKTLQIFQPSIDYLR